MDTEPMPGTAGTTANVIFLERSVVILKRRGSTWPLGVAVCRRGYCAHRLYFLLNRPNDSSGDTFGELVVTNSYSGYFSGGGTSNNSAEHVAQLKIMMKSSLKLESRIRIRDPLS